MNLTRPTCERGRRQTPAGRYSKKKIKFSSWKLITRLSLRVRRPKEVHLPPWTSAASVGQGRRTAVWPAQLVATSGAGGSAAGGSAAAAAAASGEAIPSALSAETARPALNRTRRLAGPATIALAGSDRMRSSRVRAGRQLRDGRKATPTASPGVCTCPVLRTAQTLHWTELCSRAGGSNFRSTFLLITTAAVRQWQPTGRRAPSMREHRTYLRSAEEAGNGYILSGPAIGTQIAHLGRLTDADSSVSPALSRPPPVLPVSLSLSLAPSLSRLCPAALRLDPVHLGISFLKETPVRHQLACTWATGSTLDFRAEIRLKARRKQLSTVASSIGFPVPAFRRRFKLISRTRCSPGL